jgi:hypothetical protein
MTQQKLNRYILPFLLLAFCIHAALVKHSTCANHKAINQANVNRRNLEATGVGACACARHGCFVPHSVVDLQKGERSDCSSEVVVNILLMIY